MSCEAYGPNYKVRNLGLQTKYSGTILTIWVALYIVIVIHTLTEALVFTARVQTQIMTQLQK